MIEIENELLVQLDAILNAFDEIHHVFVVDRGGFLISNQSRYPTVDPDLHHRISAIFPAMFVAGEEQGSCFHYGDIEFQFTEYQTGNVFGLSCGAGVLCVATEKTHQINEIHFFLKRFQKTLSNTLERFYCPEEQELGEIDLRAIFSSELKLN